MASSCLTPTRSNQHCSLHTYDQHSLSLLIIETAVILMQCKNKTERVEIQNLPHHLTCGKLLELSSQSTGTYSQLTKLKKSGKQQYYWFLQEKLIVKILISLNKPSIHNVSYFICMQLKIMQHIQPRWLVWTTVFTRKSTMVLSKFYDFLVWCIAEGGTQSGAAIIKNS